MHPWHKVAVKLSKLNRQKCCTWMHSQSRVRIFVPPSPQELPVQGKNRKSGIWPTDPLARGPRRAKTFIVPGGRAYLIIRAQLPPYKILPVNSPEFLDLTQGRWLLIVATVPPRKITSGGVIGDWIGCNWGPHVVVVDQAAVTVAAPTRWRRGGRLSVILSRNNLAAYKRVPSIHSLPKVAPLSSLSSAVVKRGCK